MIKILAACGAGVNSSHQIKDSIENEMSAGVEKHVISLCIKKIIVTFAPLFRATPCDGK